MTFVSQLKRAFQSGIQTIIDLDTALDDLIKATNITDVQLRVRRKQMNLVIVKHENFGQKYLFQVPKGESVYAGRLVKVKTKNGVSLATCLSDSFRMDENSPEYKVILAALGASEPLAYVLGDYYYHPFEIEENQENKSEKS